MLYLNFTLIWSLKVILLLHFKGSSINVVEVVYGLLTWRSSSLWKLTKHVVAVGGFFILAGLSASAFRLLFSA